MVTLRVGFNCFIVLLLGAWFTMEIYGLKLVLFDKLLTLLARAQVKIANVIFVLEHNNIRLNDTLN